MKKILRMVIASLIALGVTACSGVGMKAQQQEVKCPACGYAFETPR